MLSGPRQKFCEGIVSGLNATQAYLAAYPDCDPEHAAKNTTRLKKNEEVQAEIARLRKKAEERAGSAVLTLAEKRAKLAAIVRQQSAIIDGCELSVTDKLKAIALDNDLSGQGAEAEGNRGLAALIARIRK